MEVDYDDNSDEGFFDGSSEDETESTQRRPSNPAGAECYQYIPPPNPLIPKSLADIEPPRMGGDMPFLAIPRLGGLDLPYQQGPIQSQVEAYIAQAGSLTDFFERNRQQLVYKRTEAEDCFEKNACDIRKLINSAVEAGTVPTSEGIDAQYSLTGPNDRTLIFESRFECGNLLSALKITENDYCLSMQSDTNSRGNNQWFYYRIQNTTANMTVKFSIINFCKCDSLFNYGMRILVYSQHDHDDNGRGWFRDGDRIRYYSNGIRKGNGSKTYYTLTFEYTFKHTNDTVYFAFAYPYTYSDLMDDLKSIDNDPFRGGVCRRRLLCNTLAGNRLEVLTITGAGSVEEVNSRRGVVITARVHPGETVGSWMMKGVLDFLTRDCQEAELLRQSFVFKIIPMLNPDGVIAGNYRTSLVGSDLNRRWKTPSKQLHPTIYYAKSMIKNFAAERPIELVCDLHGHSKHKNVFMYGCNVQGQPEATRALPFILSKISPWFFYDYCSFKVQKSKEATMRVALFKEIRCAQIYTMESTFCGANFGQYANMHMTTNDLQAMGEQLCQAIILRCNLLPPQPPPTASQEEPSPLPEDIVTLASVNTSDIMNELLSSETLLTNPATEDSSSGSDSDPSEDNLDADELAKYVPIKTKKSSEKKRNSVRKKSGKSSSLTKSRLEAKRNEARKCSKCGEQWSRGHKCKDAEPPPPVQRVAPRQPSISRYQHRTVGVKTYYNSMGKKVHDQQTQTYKSVLQGTYVPEEEKQGSSAANR